MSDRQPSRDQTQTTTPNKGEERILSGQQHVQYNRGTYNTAEAHTIQQRHVQYSRGRYNTTEARTIQQRLKISS